MDKPAENLTAERVMIGCLAHNAELIDSLPITPEHFWHFANRLVFETIVALYREGSGVYFHTILVRLGDDALRKIGGESALYEMVKAVSAGAAPSVFEDLERALLMRRFQELAAWLHGADHSDETSAELVAMLHNRVAGLETNSDAENLLAAVVDTIHAKLARLDSGEVVTGFKTCIDVWNEAFGGIIEGQFYALAGRPGRGKTAMMEQLIADYMAVETPVVVFEKDMSPQKLIERIACRECHIPYWKFHRSRTTRDENAKIREMTAEFLRANVLRLYSPVGLTAERLCAIARREIRQGGAKCVFVDHIQALNVGKDLREGFTAASLMLRRHVTETNVPMIVLAHLNRDAGDGRPSPNNIKEFDQLFGDVDGMALLWHEADQADKDVKEVKFLVGKNRDCGELEETIMFDGPLMKFLGKKARHDF